jgi:hypothetical protein
MREAKAKLKIACPGCRQKLDLSDLEPFARIRCPQCSDEVIAPKRFGTLLLEEPLGRRLGIASYRALDLTLDREVLVQILEQDGSVHGEAFQALARRAAPLNHPGLVPIYSCGAQDGNPYVVSQYMAGGPLARRLGDWVVSEGSMRQGLGWLLPVAGGIQTAAAHAVVHGAVSPCSMVFDGEDHAKLADFGVDVMLCGPAGHAGGYAVELVGYLSPEVLNGEEPTHAADVFGFGAVLYHILTGQAPCAPVADAVAARALWQAGHTPAAPSGMAEVVPLCLSDMCLRMLSADPAQRPADLDGIVDVLTSACKTRIASAAREADRLRPRNLVLPALKAHEQRQQRSAALLRRRRHRWVDALIAAGIVAVLALGIMAYVRRYGRPSWLRWPAAMVGAPGIAQGSTVQPVGTMPSLASAPAPAASPAVGDSPAGSPSSPVALMEPKGQGGGAGGNPLGQGPSVAGARGHSARRPRPEGLDFLAAKDDLAAYLKGLAAADLTAERERIELIGDTRAYLVRLMKYVPFADGQDTGIRLRSGRVVRGAVPYCNETQVAVRPEGQEALHLVPWRDVAFEQIVGFLDFYLRLRLEQGQSATGARDPTLQREVGEDCLRIAVLCDWYGQGTLAARYARQAVELSPKGGERVRRLLAHRE